MSAFKLGDRVRVDARGTPYRGCIGTVVESKNRFWAYWVLLDDHKEPMGFAGRELAAYPAVPDCDKQAAPHSADFDAIWQRLNAPPKAKPPSFVEERWNNGCTCFLGKPPCSWCTDQPDPDAEEEAE